MLVVFAAYMARGHGDDELISQEMLEHSKAQVMSLDQAQKLGFQGIPDHPSGGSVKVIVARKQDVSWIQRRLDSHPWVQQFEMAEVDT